MNEPTPQTKILATIHNHWVRRGHAPGRAELAGWLAMPESTLRDRIRELRRECLLSPRGELRLSPLGAQGLGLRSDAYAIQNFETGQWGSQRDLRWHDLPELMTLAQANAICKHVHTEAQSFLNAHPERAARRLAWLRRAEICAVSVTRPKLLAEGVVNFDGEPDDCRYAESTERPAPNRTRRRPQRTPL